MNSLSPSFYFIIGGSFIFMALVLVLVSVPLIRRRVSMNKTYGVRLPKAFESEANWYTINRYGGIQLVLCAIGIVISGVLFLFIQPDPVVWYFWVFILAPVWLLVPVLWRIKSFARRLP